MKKALVLSYPLSAQRRLIRLGRCPGSAQSDLSLRLAHTHFVGFVMSWLNYASKRSLFQNQLKCNIFSLSFRHPLNVVSGTTDDPKETTNEEAVRSLLVITGSPPSNPSYEEFKIKVNEYDDLEPFSFPNPFNTQRKVSPRKVCVFQVSALKNLGMVILF